MSAMFTWKIAVGVALGGLVASAAIASTADLTTVPATGTINGGIFSSSDFRPVVIDTLHPFVRLEADGSEQGYNTSGRPVAFDERIEPLFIRDLTFSEIPQINIGGVLFLQFILDISEPETGVDSFLSLDEVQVYSSATGSQITPTVSSLGTLVYDMDGVEDSQVLLDANNFLGSGPVDMEMLIPLSNFNGVADSDFIYLYSQFGLSADPGFSSLGGFEEWSVLDARVEVIPLPGAAGLGLAGLATFGFIRRRCSEKDSPV